MIRIAQFRPEDLRNLVLQSPQQDLQHVIADPTYGPALLAAGEAFTAFDGDKVLGCGGAVRVTPYRAEIWSLLSDAAAPKLRPITRAVQGWLQQTSYKRLEAVVSAGFHQGHHWMRILGFEQEGPVRPCFMPDGSDAITYVRFKDG